MTGVLPNDLDVGFLSAPRLWPCVDDGLGHLLGLTQPKVHGHCNVGSMHIILTSKICKSS